jgi:exodeoxyribonuclease-3
VVVGFGDAEFDAEGRYLELRFDTPARKLSIISATSRAAPPARSARLAKFRFLEGFFPHLNALKREREFILCGDINIAHQEIDLKNFKGNRKNSGFLPEERAWMTRLLDAGADGAGLVDVYRQLKPDTTDEATPGGATAARPTRRTWVGGWTTTSPRRRWARWRGTSRSTRP